jgi:hypothetical protein
MMPQGPVWQQLRERALETIPAGVLVPFSSPPLLSEWVRNGSFSVSSATQRRCEIAAVPHELGSALMSDAAFHLDHASEHAVSVRHQLSSDRWFSSAWLTVTMYYWAYYLVMSLTRTLGKTALFLSREDSNALAVLGGIQNFGSGPVSLESGPIEATSYRAVRLHRSGRSRLHDLTWLLWFEQLKDAVRRAGSARADGLEPRLYEALLRPVNILGDSWPSDLRNLVNYMPGFAYGSVRRSSSHQMFTMVQVDPAADFETLLDRFESNVAALTSTNLAAQSVVAAKALVDMTFLLHLAANSLHEELLERRGVDRRWLAARRAFVKSQHSSYGSFPWPCGKTAAA